LLEFLFFASTVLLVSFDIELLPFFFKIITVNTQNVIRITPISIYVNNFQYIR
jgi:hypothetical protein